MSPTVIPPGITDLALQPSIIRTSALSDYDRLDYGMIIDIERTPNGRL